MIAWWYVGWASEEIEGKSEDNIRSTATGVWRQCTEYERVLSCWGRTVRLAMSVMKFAYVKVSLLFLPFPQLLLLSAFFIQTSVIVSQAFPVAVTNIWNALPDSVISSSSIDSFHHQLKKLFCSSDRSAVGILVDLVIVLITYIAIKILIDWLSDLFIYWFIGSLNIVGGFPVRLLDALVFCMRKLPFNTVMLWIVTVFGTEIIRSALLMKDGVKRVELQLLAEGGQQW